MDIINPEVIVFGKRYYRVNMVKPTTSTFEDFLEEFEMNSDEEPCNIENASNFDIVQVGTNYNSRLRIPSMFYGFIIGKKGEMKKRIELDTKATILIPKHGSNAEIIVSGSTYNSVSLALTKITAVVAIGRQKSPFTHFFSIHIVDTGIVGRFEQFRDEVLQHCVGDRGIEERLFQRPCRLHLTLTVMVLGDANETADAVQLLVDFRQKHMDFLDRPIRVRVRGLEYMNDDPCEVRVLYAKVESGLDRDRLQQLTDRLVECLAEKRLLTGRAAGIDGGLESPTLLHMTVMNASFLPEGGPRHFDCSNVLRKYRDWDFGEMLVDEVHLSRLHGGSHDAYYPSAATVRLGSTQS